MKQWVREEENSPWMVDLHRDGAQAAEEGEETNYTSVEGWDVLIWSSNSSNLETFPLLKK